MIYLTFLTIFVMGVVLYVLIQRYTDLNINLSLLIKISSVVFALLLFNLLMTHGWMGKDVHFAPKPGFYIGLFIVFYLCIAFYVVMSVDDEIYEQVDRNTLFFVIFPMLAGGLTFGSWKLMGTATPEIQVLFG